MLKIKKHRLRQSKGAYQNIRANAFPMFMSSADSKFHIRFAKTFADLSPDESLSTAS